MGFFRKYNTLENFKSHHKDISELFEQCEDPNYITNYLIDDVYWLEYILQNPKRLYKTIMSVDGTQHHFIVKVNEMQYVQSFKERYIVVALVDVTQDLKSKQEDQSDGIADITYLIEDSINIIMREITSVVPTRNAIVKASSEDIFGKQLTCTTLKFKNESIILNWDIIIPVQTLSLMDNFLNQEWDAEIEQDLDNELIGFSHQFIENLTYNLIQTFNLKEFDELHNLVHELSKSKKILSKNVDIEEYYRFIMYLDGNEVEIYINFDENTLPLIPKIVMLGMLF
jgi:hypothetical protein